MVKEAKKELEIFKKIFNLLRKKKIKRSTAVKSLTGSGNIYIIKRRNSVPFPVSKKSLFHHAKKVEKGFCL
jgi:hypothetical protein